MVDRKQSLASVPVLNPGVRVEKAGEDRAMVTVKLKRRRGILARFLPKEHERKVELDAFGSFVVGRIDGEASTAEIIKAFSDHYDVNRREAERSCVEFLRSLAERHIIRTGIPKES